MCAFRRAPRPRASRSAIQQLGGAIGVAVLGTVFFSVLSHHGFAPALARVMWWTVGALAIVLVVSPLLPARAREPDGAAESCAEDAGRLVAAGG